MGKKRAMNFKRIAERLITDSPDGFTADFEANKRLVNEMTSFSSKVIRNKVAGYMTRLSRESLQMPVRYGNPRSYDKWKKSRVRR